MSCGLPVPPGRALYPHGIEMCADCQRRSVTDNLQCTYVDGACRHNGSPYAVSGIGLALGLDQEDELSIPISDAVDSYPMRSNRRAELLAAISGLRELMQREGIYEGIAALESTNLVVASDSEYVVKGMTEWVPRWKHNNWRRPDGNPPVNGDLFQTLDDLLEELDFSSGVQVAFWHIPREYNRIADRLAKAAADSAEATTAAIY